MKLHNYLLAVATALALFSSTAQADFAELRSGEVLQGKYVGGTQTTIRFEVEGKMQVLPIGDVLALTFNARGTESQGPSSTGQSSGSSQPENAAAPKEPEKSHNKEFYESSVLIRAGTPFLVRTREPIDSNRHSAGHRFTATLEGDLVSDGKVVARKGTQVYGQITQSKKSGRVAGRAELGITLTGISIQGQIVPIRTGESKAVSESTAKNSASKVARGAAIGGLANGSKGAKGGAKWGAGAALVTRGNSIYVPAGSLLEFATTQNVTK